MISMLLMFLNMCLRGINFCILACVHIVATIQAVVIVSSKTAQRPTRRRRVRAKVSRSFTRRLPDEVWTVVFEMVAGNKDKGDLVNCSRVSRQWHKLVTPVLWRAPEPLLPEPSAAPSNFLDKHTRRPNRPHLANVFPVHREKYGREVRSLVLTHLAPRLSDRALNHIVQHCPRLASIHLEQSRLITAAGFKALAKAPNAPNIHTLHLTGCEGLCDLGLVALAKRYTSLQEINFSNCANITDRGIQVFLEVAGKTLRRISLSHCRHITGETVNAIANACNIHLEALDVSYIRDVYDKDIQLLVTKCPNLTLLNVARKKKRSDLVFDIRGFVEIQRLSENSRQHLSTKWRDRTKTMDMITRQLPKLRSLDLSHWNPTDKDIRDLLDYNQTLTYLRVANRSVLNYDLHKKKQIGAIRSPSLSSSSLYRTLQQRQGVAR